MLGNRATLDALLRAKAHSLLAMMPACPILTAYGLFLLRAVGGGKLLYSGQGGHKDYWEHELALNYTGVRPVQMGSRLVMEKVFGVSTSTQLSIEAYLGTLTRLQDLELPQILQMMHSEWYDYANKYLWTYLPSDPDVFFS
jgi:hypothetical protein